MVEALQWGQVDLMPTEAEATALGYMVEASSDGTNWGNPGAVVTAIQSRLQDGSLAEVTSFENREAPIHIRVTSPTYQGLVNAEKALVAETRRPGYNTLTWTPNVALAQPSVFDVIYGVLTYDFDDLGEVNLERHFVATLACLPFPRSATEVVATAIPAPPGSETSTNINNGSSTTGWSAVYTSFGAGGGVNVPATVSTAGGAVSASSAADSGQVFVAMTLTGTVGSLGTNYLKVDWKSAGGTPTASELRGDAGTKLFEKIAEGPSPTAGYTRAYFKAPGAVTSVSDLTLIVTTLSTLLIVARTVSIDTIDRTDTPPANGTRRQLMRTLAVAGTMRTQGRMAITHETSSLGEVLAYVYQNDGSGYIPALRPYYFAGGTVTPDTSLVSGGRNMLDTLVEYRVPANKVVAGNHHMMAKIRGNSAGPVTLNVGFATSVGGTDVPGSIAFATTVNVGTGWGIVDLGPVSLPTALLPEVATSAIVRISIQDADTSGIDVDLDEAWIFNLDIGTLNHVDCGSAAPASGGSSKRLWFDPATVTNDGQDAIFRGHATDRSDAFHPADSIKGYTPPLFEPATMNVYTVCTNALDVAVELRHYPRFLHNVGVVP